jgi:hypothetical protein
MAQRIEGRRPGRGGASRHGAGGAPGNPPASNRGVKSVKTTKDAPTPKASLRGSRTPKRLPSKRGTS